MKLLVTAGNTQVQIDRVRCLTNIFTGRTGAAIARHAAQAGHSVTLLTSHPEVAETDEVAPTHVVPYRTFEDLQEAMEKQIAGGDHSAIVHCAAVSDYLSAGVFAPAEGTRFVPTEGRWRSDDLLGPQLVDRAAGKVKSDEPELWLRLVRAPKLVDRVRAEWGFRGVLVKFKLEVGLSDEQLLTVAEHSRRHSDADLMVANTLEGAQEYAFLGPLDGAYQRVTRADLAARLIEAVERRVAERGA